MKRCPHCDREYPDDAGFCAECGGPLEEVAPQPQAEPAPNRYCPHCGHAYSGGIQFCPHCGGRIDAKAQPEEKGAQGTAAADPGAGAAPEGKDKEKSYPEWVPMAASIAGVLICYNWSTMFGFLISFLGMLFACNESKNKVFKVVSIACVVITAILLLSVIINS